MEQQQDDFKSRFERLDVPAGMLALGALGQAGFAIKVGGVIAYIDPFLSDAIGARGGPSRAVPIAIEPAAITHDDVVLCTHEHGDHTDVHTVMPLAAASPGAPIFVSPQSNAILRDAGLAADRLVLPRLGETHQVGGMRITAIPAAHYAYEVDGEGHSRWMGFVIEAGGVTLYHSGDTIVIPEMIAALEQYRLDLALLPINGRDYFREQRHIVGNMNVREVAEFCKLLSPTVLIPTHNDMFPGNRVNPGDLVTELDRVVPRQRFHFLQAGEIYLYCG